MRVPDKEPRLVSACLVSCATYDAMKKISQRQPRSVVRELIPFRRFEPARFDPN